MTLNSEARAGVRTRQNRSSRQTVPFFAVLLVLATGCDLITRTTASQAILTVRSDSAMIEADSMSRTRIVAQRSDSSAVDIKFRCDVGRFVEAPASNPREVTLKAVDGQAQATYSAAVRPGSATIVVESGTFRQTMQINLQPARPSSVFLSADRTTAKANGSDQVNLTARLLRPEFGGYVSLGTRVELIARDASGREIESLRGVGTLERTDGGVSIAVTSSTPQAVTFTARVHGREGDVISNGILVNFVAP